MFILTILDSLKKEERMEIKLYLCRPQLVASLYHLKLFTPTSCLLPYKIIYPNIVPFTIENHIPHHRTFYHLKSYTPTSYLLPFKHIPQLRTFYHLKSYTQHRTFYHLKSYTPTSYLLPFIIIYPNIVPFTI